MNLTEEQKEAVQNSEVIDFRIVDGHLIGVSRFAYTYGLLFKIDPIGQERRYCYENLTDALRDMHAVEKTDVHPDGPWIKCKGTHLGQFVDLLNPNIKDLS